MDIKLVLPPVVAGFTGVRSIVRLGDSPHCQFTHKVCVEDTGR